MARSEAKRKYGKGSRPCRRCGSYGSLHYPKIRLEPVSSVLPGSG